MQRKTKKALAPLYSEAMCAEMQYGSLHPDPLPQFRWNVHGKPKHSAFPVRYTAKRISACSHLPMFLYSNIYCNSYVARVNYMLQLVEPQSGCAKGTNNRYNKIRKPISYSMKQETTLRAEARCFKIQTHKHTHTVLYA